MKEVLPAVFIVGDTQINQQGFQAMLEEIGVPEWHTDSDNSAEVLIETTGKLCYMSFDTSLNKNLTKTGGRNNHDYIQQGIIATGHGSVLEHVAVNLVFTNVSRVLTHELVRHRPGAAYSQTSGRYVRTDELSFWIPSVINANPLMRQLFIEAVEHQEQALAKMVEVSGINQMTKPEDFAYKKELTSALRRIVGNGVANNIACTYNHRALRHLLEVRTSQHAEEEIRMVFNLLLDQLSARYPAIYADAQLKMVKGYYEVTFGSKKV